MTTEKRQLYIFAGGGSGGHLYPGLAVAQALSDLDNHADILFLTTERAIDDKILNPSAWRHLAQPVAPMPRNPTRWPDFYRRWRASLRICRHLIGEKNIAAVLALGGYASGPMTAVASRAAVPIAMLNPDAVPGRANRFARKRADRIFLQWQDSRRHFGSAASRCLVTGCPIREDIARLSCDQPSVHTPALTANTLPEQLIGSDHNLCPGHPMSKSHDDALQLFDLSPDRRVLLIVGGSQGGHNLNAAVMQCLTGQPPHSSDVPACQCSANPNATNALAQTISRDWQLLHLTGDRDQSSVDTQCRQAQLPATVLPFTDRMDAALTVADLVIARSGASTLAELTSVGLPAILLPYPFHRDQHQLKNARILANAGAAEIVIDQCDPCLTAEQLGKALISCIIGQRVDKMAHAAAALGQPDAARTVARELLDMAAHHN